MNTMTCFRKNARSIKFKNLQDISDENDTSDALQRRPDTIFLDIAKIMDTYCQNHAYIDIIDGRCYTVGLNDSIPLSADGYKIIPLKNEAIHYKPIKRIAR